MKKLIITFIVIVASTGGIFSQNNIIKGRVISEDLQIVPLVSIMINDMVEVGKTDHNGFFQIEIPDSVKKILLRDVGFEQAVIQIVDTCDEVDVVMMLSGTYDFMTLKKVDRLRKRKFNKLPELHKVAFERGIFKTDKGCYTQEFIPYYTKKQK